MPLPVPQSVDLRLGLKLRDIVYTSGPPSEGEPMTERERDRNAARRLAILRHAREVTGNVSRTCRYYGITRRAYYTWLRRYEELGLEGLRDRSRRPHASPNATGTEVVGKIGRASCRERV